MTLCLLLSIISQKWSSIICTNICLDYIIYTVNMKSRNNSNFDSFRISLFLLTSLYLFFFKLFHPQNCKGGTEVPRVVYYNMHSIECLFFIFFFSFSYFISYFILNVVCLFCLCTCFVIRQLALFIPTYAGIDAAQPDCLEFFFFCILTKQCIWFSCFALAS